jgi:hypothetical protein
MKRLMLILPLIALAGCASNVALKDASDATQAVGTLTLTWLIHNSMEVTLDGKRYVGEWDSERCLNVECRGVYGNVPKYIVVISTRARRSWNPGRATAWTASG